MARKTGETKAERIARAVAQAVHAGKEWHLPVVDFNDPARPKTCLEVDFPIVPINRTSSIEASSGAATKPIYRLSKWWARRQSSVFRAMLIAAATKAPEDHAEAAKLVWDAYYGNHQKNEAFSRLKVADIFMGGGTTVVEGARLGMQMYGNDLNPVAWFVVKNELAQVDPADVQKLLYHIEAEVKPQIMPFYACDCPRGHKGKWTHKPTQRVMGRDFDPLSLSPEQRPEYEYEGPEIIYTFWSKHGPCQNAECGHRTPIMSSPVVAEKSLSVGVWRNRACAKCSQKFDVEADEARLAPAALFVCSPEETPYTIRKGDGSFDCPHCGYVNRPALGNSDSKDKKIDLTLLVHLDWLKGAPGKAAGGLPFGGSATDDAESTARWNTERASTLKLIEVRGPLPDEIKCPDTDEVLRTGSDGGTVPKKSSFACRASTCGRIQDILEAVTKSGRLPQFAAYAIQGYCPECDRKKAVFDGRFFTEPAPKQLSAARREWIARSEGDLADYWPKNLVPEGFKTTYQRIPEHGYPRFADMHNARQLIVHSQLLRSITRSSSVGIGRNVSEYVLAAFQQYLRYNSGFSFWHLANNQISAFLSNNNYPPKNTIVESSVFSSVGDGSWRSVCRSIQETSEWAASPWDIVAREELEAKQSSLAKEIGGKSHKVYPGDQMQQQVELACCSSTSLSHIGDKTFDLVITDPPFGNNIQYSELADFFHVWLRLALAKQYPCFAGDYSPKSLEAVVNPVRQPEFPDEFYKRVLTTCWKETCRTLKDGGLLAFTFHHSEDEPWVAVLESLFDAGFYLEATYPIRSDGTRGEGGKPGTFGSQLIEYDIIHVCRKRTEEPTEVSWARLRRQINQDVRQLQDILTKHQTAGLQEADLQVIRRGKALEYYSKHYGKVYVERGREFTVREALLAINQLLDDQADTAAEAPPVLAEPYTRQFFRLFADKTSLPRDQMSKYLRGTGVSPQEFIDRGWCSEKSKVFTPITPLAWAQSLRGVRRDAIGRDFDQVMLMVGACCEGSGIKLSDNLDNPNFKPHPATEPLLDWLTRHGGTATIKSAARTALQLYRSWVARNQKKVEVERTLFDLLEEET